MNPVCLFAGDASAPNVGRLVSNLYEMVHPNCPIDIVSGRPEALDATVPDSALWTYDPSSVTAGTRALTRYARTRDPAVLVQITDPPIHGTIVGIVGHATGVPTVYRYSGDRFYEYRVVQGKQRLNAFALGTVINRVPLALADEHLVLGPVGQRRLIARGVDAESITVLPPTIHTGPFEAAAPATLNVPDGRHIVLFVGRVSRLKGKETLEAAIPTVLERRSDVHFVCVGPANDGLNLPPEARNHVTLVGRVPPAEVPAYMQAADLLVHPSLTEGIPRVLLEALATETPVLAREVGDVATVTENTFRTDTEFIDQLHRLEELPVDDIEPFARETLSSRYCAFFERFTETT